MLRWKWLGHLFRPGQSPEELICKLLIIESILRLIEIVLKLISILGTH